MSFQPGSSDDDYRRSKQAILELGENGPFDAADALAALSEAGLTDETASVARILGNLIDLQVIVRLGGDEPRWELVID